MKKLSLSIFLLAVCSSLSFAQRTKIAITTEYGKIVMELYDETPKHRDNMIKLVNDHFYDSTLFHRCIPSFVIQGGDPNSKNATATQMLGNGEVGYKVDAEFNDSAFHKYGAVGMARDNNPQKASSGCQFYIVTGKKYTEEEIAAVEQRTGKPMPASHKLAYETIGGTPHLDGGYTVYGEVIEGMDVVEKISKEPRNEYDRPNTDMRMLKVEVVKPSKEELKKAKKEKKKKKENKS